MNYTWYDLIGNIGAALILAANLLLQLKRLSSDKLIYSSLNGFGAVMIIFSLIFEFNFSAFIVEFFWLMISIFGFIRIISLKINS
jgi:hypothetical protein